MKKTAKFWLAISLILCLISSLGSSIIQTDYGNVTIKEISVETESGHLLTGLLFVPDTATSETPAPAIATSHGWYNNREMQDLNYIEYARRGYVVFAIDMYGHGHSEIIDTGAWWNPENGANGMYDAVKMLVDLPYVDSEKVGVTGHSNGALASRVAVLFDNEAENPLISAAFLVSNDAVYTDADGNFVDVYGSRDVGIVACQYDEFFHRVPDGNGFYSPPKDYINQATAQSFLNFGQDPAGLEVREAYTMYKEDIDGQEATRVIYNPEILHAWAHFSQDVVTMGIDFFEDSFGAPNPIDSNSQVWPIKTFFNAIGLVGLVIFMVSITKVLLSTQTFASLKSSKEVMPAKALTGKSKTWFIISSVLAFAFSFTVYMYGAPFINSLRPSFMPQQPPFFIGVWAALCGLFGLLLVFIGSKFTGVKVDTALNGVKISLSNLLKTIILSVVVVFLTFGIVFLADYFFKSDFRLWVLAVRTFTPDKILIALSYLPLYLIYYVANSVIVNSYNYFEVGKKPWINTALNALLTALPSAVMILIMYTHFFSTGYMINELNPGFGGSIIGIWLFPIVVILPVAVVVSRKIFKECNNPYLPGLILGLFITLMTCSNTLTSWIV